MKIKYTDSSINKIHFYRTEYDSNGAHDFTEYYRYAKNPTVKVSTNFSQQINCEKIKQIDTARNKTNLYITRYTSSGVKTFSEYF